MPTGLDEGFTRSWYGRLPAAFRDLDHIGDLYGFMRLFGDPVGGMGLLVDVLGGDVFVAPIVLPSGATVSIVDGVVVVDGATVDSSTGGVLLDLDPPVTVMDVTDPAVLVVTSGDWVLADPVTVPPEWLPWVAQMVSVDLGVAPPAQWGAWVADPASRAVGSLGSVETVVGWHVVAGTVPVVTRVSLWSTTVTVPAAAITTTVGGLEAALALVEPAGVALTLVTT